MGNEYSVANSSLLEELPPEDYANSTWRSERVKELDTLGGLNRPPIARGGSFSAKLQFLAEQVKKQGDVMQEMLLPPPPAKQEAKYTGFMLATEKRAFERLQLEAERAAAAAAAAADAEAMELAAAAGIALHKPGTVYDRGGAPMPKPPPAGALTHRARRPQVGPAAAGGAQQLYVPIAPWRLRMWAARRRVMLILLTVMRLRRGKWRHKAGNKLDNLGFMIPRVLADDLARFVEEQRKYTNIKEELEASKQTLDDMLTRNGTGSLGHGPGALTDESPWNLGIVASPGVSRQVSMARQPSNPPASAAAAALATATVSAPLPPGVPGSVGGTSGRQSAMSVGRMASGSRSRGSDSGVVAAAAAALRSVGVSPMRARTPHAPGLLPVPPPGGPGGAPASGLTPVPPLGGVPTLGVVVPGPPRVSASGLRVGMGLGFLQAPPAMALGEETPPGSPMQGAASNGNPAVGSPKTSIFSGGPLAALIGGPGRRSSTPGRLGSPGAKDSPPASRESSMTQQMSAPHPAAPPPPLPSSAVANGRRSSALAIMPPTPSSVTAQLAGASAALLGGLSSMAARRFGVRPAAMPVAPGLVTTVPTGPLHGRISVTSAVAAKHGQIMQVQSQIEAESGNLKKSAQMLAMYVNRSNAAWAEAQAWGPVEASAVGELEAFCYSEQYRIYQADLVRRLRQGTICLQVFAGEDGLVGNEKQRPASGTHAPPPPHPPLSRDDASVGLHSGARSLKPNSAGTMSTRVRTLHRMDSAGSNGSTSGYLGGGGSLSGNGNGNGGGGGGAAPGGGGGNASISGAAPGAAMPTPSSLAAPRRRQQDLWTADPWDLIDRFRPGIMPQTDRIQGPTLGARILCQLALAVEALAGQEALAVMPVLLHINEEQMEDVVSELWSYRFFGLKRENVMLLASPLHTGYRFNHEYKVFEKEYGASVAPLGSGYSMLQLTWAGEAFIVGAEGAAEPLDMPALLQLQERKVEWLVSRRARDLALLSREAILDVPMLAYCMALKDRSGSGGLAAGAAAATGSGARANMVIEVASYDNLVDARALDSLVMKRMGPAGSGVPPVGAHGGAGGPRAGHAGGGGLHSMHYHPHHHPGPSHGTTADGGLPPPSPSGAHLPPPPPSPSGAHPPPSPGAHPPPSPAGGARGGAGGAPGSSGGAAPGSGDPPAIVELRLAELGTPKMTETLNYMRAIRDGQVMVGLGRYLLHVPSLAAIMPNASALRPKLSLHEELVRVTLDLGDLTAAPRARTLAVHARSNQGVLLSPDDLEKVIPLLQAQDHDVAFRDMLAANRSEDKSLSFVASQASTKAGGGQVIVVFVVANRVSAAAVDAAGQVARPGRDCIRLVTCVSNDLQRTDAEELLRAYQKRLLKSMVDTTTEVLVRGMWGLLDVMENYVAAVDAHMVVMGSQHLTSNDFNYVIGSITLSALKRLHVPVMVVTANSRNNMHIGGDADGPTGRPGSVSAGPGAAASGGPSAAGAGGPGPGPGAGPGGGAGAAGGGGSGQRGLRFLTLVENHARNALEFLCNHLMDARRGDRLLLAQVQATRHLTRQQAATVRRALDNFNLLASGWGFSVNRVLQLEGALDDVLSAEVGLHHIQVLALALPQGIKTLPPVLINLLRSCRGVTLVYKEPIGGARHHGAAGAAASGPTASGAAPAAAAPAAPAAS